MKKNNFLYIIIIGLSSFFFLHKMILLNMIPESADLLNRIPIDNWAKNYLVNNNNIMPQWFPNLFSGMPSYGGFIYAPADPIRKIFDFFNFNIGLRYWFYFIVAGIGMFYYLRTLNISKNISLFGSLCFSISPYLFGLIYAGHPAKLYAITFIPLLIMFSQKIINSRKIKYVLLLVLFTSFQLWTKHVQIVYYTWMLITFNWVWYLISSIYFKKNQLKDHFHSLTLLFVTVLISVITVSNPYYSIYEFQKESTRSSIESSSIKSENETQNKWNYTTQWSFHPKESISFIYPYFYGLQNFPTRDVNSLAYWGMMPFTQSTHYMGFIVIFLTIIGFFVNKLSSFYWSMIISSILILIIGFGKFFPILFWPLYKFAPLFNSFRVPSMIYILLPFTFSVLACFGLSGLIEEIKKNNNKLSKNIIYPIILFFFLTIFLFLFGRFIIDFLKIGDEIKFNEDLLKQIKITRINLFQKGLLIALIQSILSFGVIWLVNKKYIKIKFLTPIFILILIFDFMIINNEFRNLKTSSAISFQYRPTKEVQFLKENLGYYRIFPIEQFNSNWYSYFNIPSIGGYRPVKLKYYQDLIDSQAFSNPNIQNILNIKYLLTKKQINDSRFSLVHINQFNIYENLAVKDKAWFVENVQIVDKEQSLIKVLDDNFNPDKDAYIYKEVDFFNSQKVKGKLDIKKYSENEIILNVNTRGEGFIVLSEIFYEPGWEAFINRERIEIYRTNHFLRGVFVPSGTYDIVFKVKKNSFLISNIISYSIFFTLLIFIYFFFRPARVLN